MNVLKSIAVWFIGLSFMIVMFPLTLIIWLLALPFDRERVVIHWILIYQSLFLAHLIPIWKIDIEGREKTVKGTTYVIISNHQSILDILLLNCLKYKFKWISKIENIKVPVLGWYLRMAGYITVNRGNEESKAEMFERSLNTLKRGISIMIFPEGTRSFNEKIQEFKSGVEIILKITQAPILPAVIQGNSKIFPKSRKIYSLAALGTMNVIFGKIISPEEYLSYPRRKFMKALEAEIRMLDAKLKSMPYYNCRGITTISDVMMHVINFNTTCLFYCVKVINFFAKLFK